MKFTKLHYLFRKVKNQIGESTMDELDWDEFAPEYYQNQLESRTTIVEDVIVFLKVRKYYLHLT